MNLRNTSDFTDEVEIDLDDGHYQHEDKSFVQKALSVWPGWLKTRLKQRFRFSRLTVRIIAINLFVLLIPVFGLFWANQYHDSLVKSQIRSLQNEGHLIATTLANVVVFTNDELQEQLLQNRAERLIHVLTDGSSTRVRLFRNDGSMIVDSLALKNPGGRVEVQEIKGTTSSYFSRIQQSWRRIFSPNRIGVPIYSELAVQIGDHYSIVREAFLGNLSSSVQQDTNGELVLSVAVPVSRYRNIFGVLMVSRDRTGIDDAIRDIRITILQVFLVALLIMVLLSLWLSGTIVRPVIALANGADRVRNGKPHQYEIPDFSKRRDEIGELSHSLRDMTESLWSRIDAIDSFAADVSHEIKNPLTSIKSALETTQMIKDPDKRALLMNVALADIERLDRLITDISNASRLDAELTRGDSEIVDIREMLTTLVESSNLTRKEGQGLLSLSGVKSNTVFVKGIEGRLGQVLNNLISNARSFSPENGEIRLSVRKSKTGFVSIIVEDQGPGIPEDKVTKVFNRFYTDRPEAAFGNHSGLGLSISQQIAVAHGGDLIAGNRYGASGTRVGAKFTLSLPIFRQR
ncbi:MAG: stimulus-sensing domain-containing protein [Alphaproteobacteria bacterium]